MANALLDMGKKTFNPDDYPCSLCMVTYGPFGMKKDWKNFTKNLPYPSEFLHKDELSDELSQKLKEFPALVLEADTAHEVLLDHNDFNSIQSLDDLKQKVNQVTSK